MNAPFSDLRSEHWTKPVPPKPNRLVTDIDAPLEQQIFYLPQGQRVTDIHHHREADYLRRTVEITEGILHPRRLRNATPRLKPICSDKAISGGTFATNWDNFYLQIKNGKIRGCYDYDAGEFDGALDGGFLNINWRENGNQTGKAVLAITRDGSFLNGWWYEKGKLQGTWFGPRTNDANEPKCAAKLNVSKVSKVERALSETGRAVLYGVRFDHDSATLKPESVAALEQLLEWLIAHPLHNINIAGHTDWNGADAYNQSLSERRAAAVLAWLVGRSIATSRLSSKGFGESQPVADNASPQGRSLNRRVEVRVLN